jgi:hypothetical protein
MSYSQHPTRWLSDLHGPMCGHSVLLLVANNERKDALTHIVDGHQRVIHGRYDVMAGTTGTLEAVQKRFPTKQFIDLGHGPEFGDIWAIVFMLEHLARGSRLEALVLFDPDIEKHQPFKLALFLSLLKANAVWFPTPASAAAFFHAVDSSGEEADLLSIHARVHLSHA